MGPLGSRVVDTHVAAVQINSVQLLDAERSLFGSSHLDESETSRSAGLRGIAIRADKRWSEKVRGW